MRSKGKLSASPFRKLTYISNNNINSLSSNNKSEIKNNNINNLNTNLNFGVKNSSLFD